MGMAGGLIAGGGIAGTRAALPIPLGSLTDPLRPRAFPGPGAMPLTPASWPGDLEGAARQSSTTHNNDTLPIEHRQGIIETSGAFLFNRTSLRHIMPQRRTCEEKRKFPKSRLGQPVNLTGIFEINFASAMRVKFAARASSVLKARMHFRSPLIR